MSKIKKTMSKVFTYAENTVYSFFQTRCNWAVLSIDLLVTQQNHDHGTTFFNYSWCFQNSLFTSNNYKANKQ